MTQNSTPEIVLTGTPSGLWSDATALTKAAWRMDRPRFLLQVFYLLFNGVIGGINLLLLVPIVNSVAGQSTIDVPVFGSLSLSTVPLWLLLGAFVALATVQALITRASAINAAQFQPRLVDELRQQTFGAVLAARWEFVLGKRKSDMVSIVTVGAARCGVAFQQLLKGAVSFVLAISTAAVAILVSPTVTLIALTGALIFAGVQAAAIRPTHRLGRQLGEKSRNLQGVIQDSLDSLRLVRAHDAADTWSERLVTAITDTREVQIDTARRQGTAEAWASVGLAASAAVLVLVCVQLDVPPASIVVLLVLIARLARLMQSIARTGVLLANSLPAVSDIAELTNEAREAVEIPAEVTSRTRELTADSVQPLVFFDSVGYVYPGSDNGIADVTFEIPRGRITALTGPSGAGKSTCADLVLGLLEPRSGTILVDGLPLEHADLRWWRQQVAYVPQETVLFPGTLRANLIWSASPPPTDEQCWVALDKASADFARDLPDGLDTVLGDRGLRLSGGERQRVAIARALLRNPVLLVMDEATSSLDDRTELAVVDLVRSLVPAVTVLAIAHRQSTIDAADNVVRLSRD